jgi:hypothetical protein
MPSSDETLSGVEADDPLKRAAPRFAFALALFPHAAPSAGSFARKAELHAQRTAPECVQAHRDGLRGWANGRGTLCHRFELGDACTLSSNPENAVSSLLHIDASEPRSDCVCAKYLRRPNTAANRACGVAVRPSCRTYHYPLPAELHRAHSQPKPTRTHACGWPPQWQRARGVLT